jgi:hypothetical protein
MKKSAVITIIIVIIVVVLLGWWIYSVNTGPSTSTTTTTGGTGTTGIMTSSTPGGPNFNQTISDGAITFSYPSAIFALATNEQQILVSSYIPPCNGNFDYCLYYNSTSTYAGTNFETAGIRIDQRTDLTTQSQCLNTAPDGFTGATSTVVASSSAYMLAEFPNVGGAAAGHFAAGSLYRLFYPASGSATSAGCYEFETRIGQSDYLNYPSGSIQQFTTADQAIVQSQLQSILGTVTLPDGLTVAFPQ